MSSKARFASLVAVRMKSTRLAGKSLLPICGRPLLWHLMDRVGRARIPFRTVICTSILADDDPIAEFAEDHGLFLFRGHPDDVLSRFIEAAEDHKADHVVRITGDNPLTDTMVIDNMCQLHLSEGADYTYTEDPPRGTRPEVISLAALQKCHELAEDPDSSEYMTLYFRDYPQVFKNAEYNCMSYKYCRPDYIVTVDTAADFEIVERIYSELYGRNRNFTLLDIINFLDAHPEIDHAKRQKQKMDTSRINTRLRIV